MREMREKNKQSPYFPKDKPETHRYERRMIMSAFTYFGGKPSHTFGFTDSQYIVNRSDLLALTEPQLKYLNPGVCKHVSPYSENFWQDMKNWITPISKQHSASYPKAPSYRHELEPYLLRKVTMTAGFWRIRDIDKVSGLLHLVLTDVRLSHVYSNSVGSSPNIAVDHLNVWVSPSWLNRACAVPGTPLTVSGILYEYVSSKNTRNIGIIPILLMPKGQAAGSRRKHSTARPDISSPGVFA